MKKIILIIIIVTSVLFYANAQENKIESTGNVGIGTISPTQKLEVKGNILLKSDSYVHYAIERGNGAKSAFGISSNTHDGFLSSSGNLKFLTNNNGTNYVTSMFIKSNGNVGIGTTEPKSKFEIEAEAAPAEKFITLKTNDASRDYFSINNATLADGQFIPNIVGKHISDNRSALYLSGYIEEANDQGDHPIMTFDSRIEGQPAQNRPLFGWDTHGLRKMTLAANGNLGIGTSEPVSRLFIKQSFNKKNGGLSISDNVGRLIQIYGEGSAGRQVIGTSATRNPLAFDLNGNEKMRINENGNVGIGTTKPDMKLTVNGNIHAKEIKVDLNIPAPDYVFEEDYDLRSIAEVEKYIKTNGHLPEIPSAKEFEENGVMQVEMDMNLLKKIEELMLYTIQQQKEIESQAEEIRALKKYFKN